MALYYARLVTQAGSQGAFDYVSATKSLNSTNSLTVVEEGDGWWAIKIDGDYALVYDEDGLIVGDLAWGLRSEYPRVDFYSHTCGVSQMLASLTKQGRLFAPGISESDIMPADSFNLYDQVTFTPGGVIASKVNELWLLTDGSRYICDDGKLIAIKP
jgi:hypothetical protein